MKGAGAGAEAPVDAGAAEKPPKVGNLLAESVDVSFFSVTASFFSTAGAAKEDAPKLKPVDDVGAAGVTAAAVDAEGAPKVGNANVEAVLAPKVKPEEDAGAGRENVGAASSFLEDVVSSSSSARRFCLREGPSSSATSTLSFSFLEDTGAPKPKVIGAVVVDAGVVFSSLSSVGLAATPNVKPPLVFGGSATGAVVAEDAAGVAPKVNPVKAPAGLGAALSSLSFDSFSAGLADSLEAGLIPKINGTAAAAGAGAVDAGAADAEGFTPKTKELGFAG